MGAGVQKSVATPAIHSVRRLYATPRSRRYLVKEITQCKLCVTCCRRKLRPEFTPDEWGKRCPAQCNQCKGEGQHLTNQGTGRRGKRRARGSSQKVRDEYQQCVVVQHVEKADEEGLMASRRSKRTRRQERENLADRDDSASEADVQDDEWEPTV